MDHDDIQEIAEMFEEKFDAFFEEEAFNGVIAVGLGDEIVFEKAWGVANLDEDPLQTDTIFNLASVSKQMTALCIMLLNEDGALAYDDSIAEYIAEFEGTAYEAITIRHLLQHTSGLADYMDLLEEHWEDEDEIATNDDLIELFAEIEPDLEFEPGEKHDYSNTGYAFLASIVERASEQDFESFLHERIFAPLGMTHSFGYRTSNGDAPHETAFGFVWEDDERVAENTCYMDGIIGDGNIFSNVEDLVKYHAALCSEALLPEDSLAEAYTPAVLNNGKKVDYGFGWDLFDSADFVSHTGSWMGFRTYFVRDLDSQAVFIALDNSSNEDLTEQVDEVVDSFYS